MLTTSPSPRLEPTTSNEGGHSFVARGYRDSGQSPIPRAKARTSSSPIVRPSLSHVFPEQRSSLHSISHPFDSATNYKQNAPTVSSTGTQTLESSFSHSHPHSARLVDAATQSSPTLAFVPAHAPQSHRSHWKRHSASAIPISPLASKRSRSPPSSPVARLRLHESSQAQPQHEPVPSSAPNVLPSGPDNTSSLSHAAMPPGPAGASQAIHTTIPDPTDTKPVDPDTTSPASTYSTSSKRNHSSSEAPTSPSGDKNDTTDADTQAPDAGPAKRPRPEDPAVKIMPVRYENCNTRDLVILISSMLMELIRYNDAIPLREGHLTRFHSRAPPGISVIDYLQRLTTYATLSPPILLSMVFYIDKLCALYPAFTISSLTVHRFLITSATVASKGLSDSFWNNKTYAKVGGVSLRELALLELEFLVRVQWRIVPQPEVLVDYYRSLVERSPGYEMEKPPSSTAG